MEMQVNSQLIRAEREQRAWSQSHLASVSGLGLRTIQRIEGKGRASYESAGAIAAAFSMTVAELQASHALPAWQMRGTEWFSAKRARISLAVAGLLVVAAVVYMSDRPSDNSSAPNIAGRTEGTTGFLAQAEDVEPDDRLQSAPETRQIAAYDRLAVQVQGEPNLSRTVAVADDGTISMPLAGNIIASGKTAEELSTELERALSIYIRIPEVSVLVEGA